MEVNPKYQSFYDTYIVKQYTPTYLQNELKQHQNISPKIIYPTPMYVRPNWDWLTHLKTFGWTVVDIDLDTDTIVNEFYDYLEMRFIGFNRNRSETFSHIYNTFFGIISDTIGHSRFAWTCRKATIPIFERIYDTNQLLSSFDGGNFLHSNVIAHEFYLNSMKSINESKLKKNWAVNWLHLDQLHPKLQPEFFYQGLVNLLDNGPDSGGLIVIEGSHNNNYYSRHPLTTLSSDTYNVIYDGELQKLPLLKICAKPGQLVLWSSNTVHCNCYPINNNRRMCTYVSMAPKARATKDELKRRIEFFENRIMTGHAPYGIWFEAKEESLNNNRLLSDVEYYQPADNIVRSLVGY